MIDSWSYLSDVVNGDKIRSDESSSPERQRWTGKCRADTICSYCACAIRQSIPPARLSLLPPVAATRRSNPRFELVVIGVVAAFAATATESDTMKDADIIASFSISKAL
jgi:hypothetical protein